MSAPILRTEHVSRSFGGLQAVRDVTISLQPGAFHSIIGPNGAGKTTLFNMMSGALRPTAGRIFFKERDITGMPLHRVAQLGIGRAYQITSLFPSLPVLENVRLAAQAIGGDNFKLWQHSHNLRQYTAKAEEVIALVGLSGREQVPARALAHGDKRKLELALLLAGDPALLLLDEPTAGMASGQVPELMGIINELRTSGGRTIILVEHRMDVVMAVSDRITVMHQGAVLAEGTPREIAADEQVQQAYLGELYQDLTV
ncbi:MAG: Branched-chain amino acid transport ATP-binding protein LivG [uncultured Chloroflexia bacterium]|uniref:Branched-chain amino acid transport ATP-binding protein LivG n=1 Tax=uncultured Chloroflexia bacterium TaxID=1672391 RepID=A0A6J4K9S7_9CHLR|nr:MAG: Branched-chain amino acid transport ATP-binding protein LivG [uncultured Chloroflexia bacterium]